MCEKVFLLLTTFLSTFTLNKSQNHSSGGKTCDSCLSRFHCSVLPNCNAAPYNPRHVWCAPWTFFPWQCCMACKVLVPRSGIEPGSMVLTTGPPGNFNLVPSGYQTVLLHTLSRLISLVCKVVAVIPIIHGKTEVQNGLNDLPRVTQIVRGGGRFELPLISKPV